MVDISNSKYKKVGCADPTAETVEIVDRHHVTYIDFHEHTVQISTDDQVTLIKIYDDGIMEVKNISAIA